jgi:hypothetical protein
VIVLAIFFGAGAVTGAGAAILIHAHRDSRDQIDDYHLRREVTLLREVNSKLSLRCGHCGTGRTVPTGSPR